MNVQGLIVKRLGVDVIAQVGGLVTSIPVTAGQLLQNNPNRVGFLLVNLGATDAYVGPFPDVSVNKGIFVAASGGSLKVEYTEDYILPTYDWYGIAAIATNILIMEMLIERGV